MTDYVSATVNDWLVDNYPKTEEPQNDDKLHIVKPTAYPSIGQLIISLCGKEVPYEGPWKKEYYSLICQECWVRKDSFYSSGSFPV